ncbi:MAG: exodeoxyribonuclease V subunit beta [Candidatus Makana argininalis]
MIKKIFNSIDLPLFGNILIEASAGTGKTYTISILYLRLILGMISKNHFKPIKADKILIVTFTELAKNEIKNRIIENINLLYNECIKKKSNNYIIMKLFKKIKNIKIAKLLLIIAKNKINELSIYTIHGFCKKILNKNIVQSGIIFDKEIIEDESILKYTSTYYFWNKNFSVLPYNIAILIKKYWKNPKNFYINISPYLNINLNKKYNLSKKNYSIIQIYKNIISNINLLKKNWIKFSLFRKFIYNSNINKKIYSKKNIIKWLNKIDKWANEPTIDDKVPNELSKFKLSNLFKNNIQNNNKNFVLFKIIENYYLDNLSIKKEIFLFSVFKIEKYIIKEKNRRSKISFNDLITILEKIIQGKFGSKLSNKIRKLYPVAIIDEFQDTDLKQYNIFKKIYIGYKNCFFLIIGDPKQSIYGFRGADILTYIRAKNEINNHYTLDVNWRSSKGMINAVNNLFTSFSNPFIFKEISFVPLKYSKENKKLKLIVNNKIYPAMNIWIQPDIIVNSHEYKKYMSNKCANTIFSWINSSNKKKTWIEGNFGKKYITASDITIIIRNGNEANLISNALTKFNIPSIFISKSENIFKSKESVDLMWILKAVLYTNNLYIKKALITDIIGFDFNEIKMLNKNKKILYYHLNKFIKYKIIWKKYGIHPMIKELIKDYKIKKKLLFLKEGEKKFSNLMHLGELLQEESIHFENRLSIIRLLEEKIYSSNKYLKNTTSILKNNNNFVNIITVHKSKGLEFPIVFLPFIADYRIKKNIFYLNSLNSKISINKIDIERLAEDLRILYVSLTRSIYHCSIGISSLHKGKNRKTNNNSVHKSAIGYLIQNGVAGDINFLENKIKFLVKKSKGDIIISKKKYFNKKKKNHNVNTLLKFKKKKNINNINIVNDTIISYSSLNRNLKYIKNITLPKIDIFKNSKKKKIKIATLNQHNFPTGKITGNFLHILLKNINFKKKISLHFLNKIMNNKNIDIMWKNVIIKWIENIIDYNLDNNDLSLKKIKSKDKCNEFSFYIPIKDFFFTNNLQNICKKYDLITYKCININFPKTKGMMKGFIDLVFRWNKKYYILDYKSNWLGENEKFYNIDNIEKSIINNRYDLQYQIYTLALHRFLKQKLYKYNYKKDFGGVYYLFLRGINNVNKNNGIFYCKPNFKLINYIDKLLI